MITWEVSVDNARDLDRDPTRWTAIGSRSEIVDCECVTSNRVKRAGLAEAFSKECACLYCPLSGCPVQPTAIHAVAFALNLSVSGMYSLMNTSLGAWMYSNFSVLLWAPVAVWRKLDLALSDNATRCLDFKRSVVGLIPIAEQHTLAFEIGKTSIQQPELSTVRSELGQICTVLWNKFVLELFSRSGWVDQTQEVVLINRPVSLDCELLTQCTASDTRCPDRRDSYRQAATKS